MMPSILSPSSSVQKKTKKIKSFMKLHPDKVPIWITFKNQKQNDQKPFAIDIHSSFFQFQENIKAKYLYQGLIQNKTLFFYINGKDGKQGVIINNQYLEMGELYDLYKGNEGWLQIVIGYELGF